VYHQAKKRFHAIYMLIIFLIKAKSSSEPCPIFFFYSLLPINTDGSRLVIDNNEGVSSIVCDIISSDIDRARDFKKYFNG